MIGFLLDRPVGEVVNPEEKNKYTVSRNYGKGMIVMSIGSKSVFTDNIRKFDRIPVDYIH